MAAVIHGNLWTDIMMSSRGSDMDRDSLLVVIDKPIFETSHSADVRMRLGRPPTAASEQNPAPQGTLRCVDYKAKGSKRSLILPLVIWLL